MDAFCPFCLWEALNPLHGAGSSWLSAAASGALGTAHENDVAEPCCAGAASGTKPTRSSIPVWGHSSRHVVSRMRRKGHEGKTQFMGED